MSEFEMETIRPTMSMARDLLPGMKESWIFNDCAIGETKDSQFVALIIRWIPETDEYYYGFIPNLASKVGRYSTHDALDIAAENFRHCPNVFNREISWANIKEGHRYV